MKRGLEDGDSVEVRDTVHRTQSAQASTSSTTVASSSASPDLGSGVKLARTDSISMSSACPHLSAAFTSLQPPRPSQQVHREECTLCFDDQDGPFGVDVCLTCFNGGCTGNEDREHAALHFQKTGHALVVNVKRREKPKSKNSSSPPTKLAIAAETEADKYDYITTPKCLACTEGQIGGRELPMTDKLSEVIDGVRTALSSAQQSEVKAWEEEITPCNHTRELKQLGDPFVLEAEGFAKCRECDLGSNLWLCLTCGNLGCGRAQFGGVGGNSHGLKHYEETGHPVSVKQGTITAEGTADIYCYACNDARLDPNLASHLKHFGMNVMSLSKTEKSMTELQLEQNLKFDFNMTGEDGKEMEPVFGPALTGLRNLGNSCYMASVLQTIFSLPAFHARYFEAYRPHTTQCPNALPATCFECQITKVADGLLSGRYAKPRAAPEQVPAADAGAPIFQEGIRPSMFKALIGQGHEEFSTMRQQDADEFLKHLVTCIQRECKRLATAQDTPAGAPTHDPTNIFSFALQQRLQCLECKKVRYSVERQDAGLSLPVPLRRKDTDVKGKQAVEGVGAKNDLQADAAAPEAADTSARGVQAAGDKVEYEPVELRECLDVFTAPETLDYSCPSCKKSVQATKQTLFTTFPDVLNVQVRRFQLINWVPQKVDVPILVPVEGSLDLDRYLGTGKREDEVELPEGEGSSASGPEAAGTGVPDFDAGAMSQLTSMGFPEVRCQRALLATGNTGDAEAAMNWLFAHMDDPDIDDPIDWSAQTSSAAAAASGATAASGPDTSMLEEMGFSKAQARKALRLNGNNAEVAVAWLFENPGDAGDDENALIGEGTSSGEGASEKPLGGSAELPVRYRLKAFISHKGPSVHSGHYVAHVAEPASLVQRASRRAALPPPAATSPGNTASQEESQAWVFFNDEKVVLAPLSSASASDPGTDIGVHGLSQLAYEYVWVRA